MEIKRILYILSGNLSTTPRALQSIITAKAYYKVEILGINRHPKWAAIDKELINKHRLDYQMVSLQRKPFLNWLLSTLINKIAIFFSAIFSRNTGVSAIASAKTSYLLLKALKKYNSKYNLIIAHSYSSLYPAFRYAQKHHIPFAFDIEDYHPGEKCSSAEKKRRELLMKKLLPKAAYFTYASPLIGGYTLKLLPANQDYKHFLVNNSFSKTEFHYGNEHSEKIKLVWFSQNIAPGRGLELIVPALAKFKDKIQLTLIGNLYADFKEGFLKPYLNFIDFQSPVVQKELHQKLGEFDIGLAIELSTADFNRDICLTNKIFAYAQSGLHILATDTSAQKMFMGEHPILGSTTQQTSEKMEKAILQIIENIELIRSKKKERFEYAKRLAWEQEGEKLIAVWEKIFK